MTQVITFPDRRSEIRIGIVAPEGAQTLDIVGPLDAFAEANRQLGRKCGYDVTILATRPGPVRAASGLKLIPDRAITDPDEELDTVLVAGCPDFERSSRDSALLAWLDRRAVDFRRLGSVCNGAFVLAAAGLLVGRRATTHWAYAHRLAELYGDVKVEPDRIFVRDGSIYTSAGVTAGIDLALALIEEDFGRHVALSVARSLVVFLKRPGGQSQFSAYLAAQISAKSPIQETVDWIIANPGQDLSVSVLARRAAMSERNFARTFKDEVQMTPAQFVELSRIQTARTMLEETDAPIQKIAHLCGFETTDGLRRAFLRRLTVNPYQYRRRFHARV